MTKFYVYQLRAENEELPFYIGKSFDGSKRYIEHCHSARCKTNSCYNTLKSKKIRKLWKQQLVFVEEILAVVENEELALILESELIKKYGRRDNKTGILCNHTDGGEGGYGKIISEETKQKMSDSKKGNKINVGRLRPDMKERWSKPITMFSESGQVEQYFASLQECMNITGIHKATISMCLLDKCKYASDKHGVKHQFKFGNINEPIAPLITNWQKIEKVYQYDTNLSLIYEFTSVQAAALHTGISESSIRNCIRGASRTAGNFIWTKNLLTTVGE
ncbi:MAG: hypothetical protein EO766_11795 [Hydrotalea sp. AMD]|uniref:NUMOD1 domain-containing DNA-binding protein n=1 Tax=Hydrotalea sp. AMD TaxID=2501297 RepID=UPI001026768C|nr:NUMOD1 domain-containing DNA-binding protein [Hydrotalea sp. AMD]RWZ87207.1 MAG: hypothetical protein EO766_11795 [Hydrotalea sp. AMD]